MVYDYEISDLLLYSSEVEELFLEGNKLKIRFGNQHEWFLNLTNLRVIQEKGVYSKGTNARFNSSKNILFFAEKVHQTMCLKHWHLQTELLDAYLEGIETEIPLPETTTEIATYPEPAWLPMVPATETEKGDHFPYLDL